MSAKWEPPVIPRPPYPELRKWQWPVPGVRTWQAPAKSHFGACTGRDSCDARQGCPVGLIVTLGKPYGCDCPCHASVAQPVRKQRTRARAEGAR